MKENLYLQVANNTISFAFFRFYIWYPDNSKRFGILFSHKDKVIIVQ